MPKNTIKKSIFTRLRNNFIAEVVFLIPIGILILRMFYEQIPRELTEAGTVDGASDFQILIRILCMIWFLRFF